MEHLPGVGRNSSVDDRQLTGPWPEVTNLLSGQCPGTLRPLWKGGITGSLWRESAGDRWITLTKASDAELWCVFHLRVNKRLNKQPRRRWLETQSLSLWHHCNGLMRLLKFLVDSCNSLYSPYPKYGFMSKPPAVCHPSSASATRFINGVHEITQMALYGLFSNLEHTLVVILPKVDWLLQSSVKVLPATAEKVKMISVMF